MSKNQIIATSCTHNPPKKGTAHARIDTNRQNANTDTVRAIEGAKETTKNDDARQEKINISAATNICTHTPAWAEAGHALISKSDLKKLVCCEPYA